MTLPADIILDLHQDGLRVHVNTETVDGELRITGTYGEAASIPFRHLALLRDWLVLVQHVADQRGQGAVPVEVRR